MSAEVGRKVDIAAEVREELRREAEEPLLPEEIKLIAWSVSLGVILLVILGLLFAAR